ncbi:CMRF35-like molecule 9 isoform X2 [Ictalurus punctatus]|uniref:CMRF35-like molecule 9 isoform X2 n=1 Tax=Ictalurus punctatus TaxID=7998 RepID=A0A9F7QXI9_ICTPU|nr:CMRF35-like molecule 9 isoform X2 [Ictalurus punctatus]
MEILFIFTFCLIIAGSDAVTTVTGYRGRSVQIKCPYGSGYEEYKKYLCRGKCPRVGYNDVPVRSGSPAKDTRFSLYDDTTAKVFTVTITDLRTEDGNTYWCGIEQTGYDSYTELLLLVKTDDPAITTVSHSTHTTHSASTQSASTHSMSPSVPAEITHSTTEFPTSTAIIAVSVVLVLLLVAFLFAVALQRKKKTQVSASSPAQAPQSSSNLHVVPCPVYDYEETNDSRCLSNTLYSTAQLLSTPSELYSNTGLPTVPSDSSQNLYATVQHPSDSPDQDVYSTSQLPTIISDSSVSAAPPSVMKSGESPTYAAVSFNTRSNAAAPPVIYKNESNSCDYATVNINGCG